MVDVMFRSDFHYKKNITLLVVLFAIVLVLMFGSLPDNNLFWRELQNSGHTFLFVPVVILVLSLLRDTNKLFWQKPYKLYMAACFISLLVGVVIELIQSLTYGDASETDIVRDLAGIIVGLGLYASTDPELQTSGVKSGKRIRVGIVMLSLCVFAASMFQLAFLSVAYMQRTSAFPVVVDLMADWTKPFLRLKHASIRLPESGEIGIDGEGQLARVDFKSGIYPGISIIETSPDWTAYGVLTIEVYSKLMQSFELVLKIQDDQHNFAYSDRFNTTLTINKGLNHFGIQLEDIKQAPAGREMNMTRMKEITLFSVRPIKGLTFYVGDIRLE